MDKNGDNLSYLRYFDENGKSFFMQSADECLEVQDSTLQEPMFTEIDEVSTWPAEGYPVLLNGALIAEDEQVEMDGGIETTELHEEAVQINSSSRLERVEEIDSTISGTVVTGKGLMTTDGLFVSNELLLQLGLNNVTAAEGEVQLATADLNVSGITNGRLQPPIEITPDDGERPEELNWNDLGDVIQMLNNGSIITVNRSALNAINVSSPAVSKVDVAYEKMFETVSALKCKLCSYLCEGQQHIIEHLKTAHLSKVKCNGENTSSAEHSETNEVAKPSIKTVEMKSILNVNRNKETKQTVYLCSQCNMGYASKDNLKEHMITKHNLVNLSEINTSSENNSEKSTSPQTEMKSKSVNETLTNLVMKQYKTSKKVKCSFKGCELKFPRDDVRVTHESCHDSEQKKQFKCPECKETFSVWRICSSHLWKCHNIDMGLLSCPMCKFKSVSFSRMKVHIAIHDEEHPFVCHECGKGFKQYSQLKNHQVVHKTPELDNIPAWASQRQCDTCKKYFANSKTLKKHIQIVHNKFKPFICNICGHKAARKSMLDLHLRQHTGEKPHKCPICVYKTGDPNCLRRHIMRHEGVTKYSCPHCDYQSIQSTSYKNHLASKHPGKGGSFYCSVCSYHTVSETAYYRHKLEHGSSATEESAENENAPQVGPTESSEAVVDTASFLQQNLEGEDDETQNCFFNRDISDEAIDTGGITIPAGFELQVSL